MRSMLVAHGLDPGPEQRPLLAGTLAGLAAALPTLAVLDGFDWLAVLGGASGAGRLAVALACGAALAAGGFLYGAVFRRAANDRAAGWLFGMAFGFLLWMMLPLPLLQWLPERPVFVGRPAMGLLLGALVWGAAMGAAFPVVHRPLRAGLGAAPQSDRRTGPEAAATPEIGRAPAG
jgi:hypothetical protein